jgi:WhiB family redox-sensing transcriptional regulator
MGRTGHRTRQTRADSEAGYLRELTHAGWRDVDWSAAACRDADPELFFPIGEGELARRAAEAAKAMCARCRVTEQCLEWAVATGMSEGIWGGHTERERRLLRRRAR